MPYLSTWISKPFLSRGYLSLSTLSNKIHYQIIIVQRESCVIIHHVISHPCFCSSRSIFLVLDFITDVDADKSEFIAEPGTTIPLEFAEHLSNINFEYWFQSLQELNTKLCKLMSRVTLGNIKDILLF